MGVDAKNIEVVVAERAIGRELFDEVAECFRDRDRRNAVDQAAQRRDQGRVLLGVFRKLVDAGARIVFPVRVFQCGNVECNDEQVVGIERPVLG